MKDDDKRIRLKPETIARLKTLKQLKGDGLAESYDDVINRLIREMKKR